MGFGGGEKVRSCAEAEGSARKVGRVDFAKSPKAGTVPSPLVPRFAWDYFWKGSKVPVFGPALGFSPAPLYPIPGTRPRKRERRMATRHPGLQHETALADAKRPKPRNLNRTPGAQTAARPKNARRHKKPSLDLPSMLKKEDRDTWFTNSRPQSPTNC